ncbi:MAG: ketopantoate reductase PanE/ApbA-domain-containing protein [Olpidium bornovanus]|uniref:2-dehydropantoate 2-reductase n=1 Tax=Olpidium bornovanus TaxID=278681 RepID=A0A8H7ZVE0_9FUNG|nr:MAG: ketopantoate reductase PanE/ApbA-domain-containing protein [Olpidium bornovanus]
MAGPAAAASRWYVLGPGAIGGLVAFHLRRAGHPVTLLLRGPPAPPREVSLTVIAAAAGGSGGDTPLRITVDAEQLAAASPAPASAPITRLLVTTKAPQALDAFSRVRGRLAPGASAAVVLLTNGWGLREAVLARFYGQAPPAPPSPRDAAPQFVLGTTTHGCYRRGPREVVHAGAGTMRFGLPLGTDASSSSSSSSSSGAAADAVAELYAALRDPLGAGAGPCDPEEMHALLLAKLAVNCCVNPLTALLRVRNGDLVRSAAGRFLMRRVAAEVAPVLRAKFSADVRGAAAAAASSRPVPAALLSGEALVEEAKAVCARTSRNFSSMYQDVHRRAPGSSAVTEIDAILGEAIAMGAAARRGSTSVLPAATAAMPWSRLVFACVKALERAATNGWTAPDDGDDSC